MAVDMRKWSFFLYVIVVAVVFDYLTASIVEFVVVYVLVLVWVMLVGLVLVLVVL